MQTQTEKVTQSSSTSGVIIPQIDHITLENILSINKSLFKILIEYQHNNWLNEPDFLVYQKVLIYSYLKRLATNLQFLAAVADRNTNRPLPQIPPQTPVIMPERLNVKSVATDPTISSLLNQINPPTMVQQSAVQPDSTYVPIPPFVLKNERNTTPVAITTGIDPSNARTVRLDTTATWEEESKVRATVEKRVANAADLHEPISDNLDHADETLGGPLNAVEMEEEEEAIPESDALLFSIANEDDDGDYCDTFKETGYI